MKQFVIIICNFLVFSIFTSYKDIYVFGDSHAFFSFCEITTDFIKPICPVASESFFRYRQETFRFIVRPAIAVTMHRVGRDGVAFLDLAALRVENCIVVFNFGEVDCRCHIGRQVREKKRCLVEVINTLVENYISFIEFTQRKSNHVVCVVLSVVPPTDNVFNPDAPYYGSLSDRIIITNLLNQRLQAVCLDRKITFLDPYSMFKDQEGALIYELSDRNVHINPNINHLIKNYVLNEFKKNELL